MGEAQAPVSPEDSGSLKDLRGADYSGKKHKGGSHRTEGSCLRCRYPGCARTAEGMTGMSVSTRHPRGLTVERGHVPEAEWGGAPA